MKGAIAELEGVRKQSPGDALNRICVPVPFADFDFYYTDGEIDWVPNPGQTLSPVKVPNNFCTDLTSVPQTFWSLLPKTGRYAFAAIVHDHLYWVQTTTREQADEVLKTAMEDSKVGTVTVQTIYNAVRLGGSSAWASNAKAKAGGEKRLLRNRPPRDKLIAWSDWSKDRSNFAD